MTRTYEVRVEPAGGLQTMAADLVARHRDRHLHPPRLSDAVLQRALAHCREFRLSEDDFHLVLASEALKELDRLTGVVR